MQKLITLFFVFSTFMLFGQENCKVLKPEISGTYNGKCKNGLAQGKGVASGTDRYEGHFTQGLPDGYGVYTWANGNTYIGEWAAGMRHGIGKFTFKTQENDSILDGLWQNDMYKGPKPKPPYVSYQSGVDRYNFQKNNTTKNRVLVEIYQNGARNRLISDFTMSTSSGNDTKIGESVGYDFIIFPVTIKIRYTSRNKINTISYPVQFEFEIYEPGDWTVTLEN